MATVRQESVEQALRARIDGLKRWLQEHAPECPQEQRHTIEGTAERVYWHYGYMVALYDVVRLLHERDDKN